MALSLESQVCSLELAKKLKELGVKQESLWWWQTSNTTLEGEKPHGVYLRKDTHFEGAFNRFSAFTVAELGEMLPVGYHSGKSGVGKPWVCKARRKSGVFEVSDTEADARAKMLCHLIEQKIIKL